MGYNVTLLEKAFITMLDRWENDDATTKDYFPKMRENSKLKANDGVTSQDMSDAAGVDINRYCDLCSVIAANVIALVTCNGDCHGHCGDGCYAIKNELCHGSDIDKNNCLRAHAMNAVNAMYRTNEYFEHIHFDIERAIKRNNKRGRQTYVRIHAAGDFATRRVLRGWIETARKYPDVHFLAFTKQYAMLQSIDAATVPSNLNIVVSIWPGLDYPAELLNVYPAAIMHDGANTKDVNALGAVKCPGNCGICKLCWYLKAAKYCSNDNGLISAVYFDKH